MRKIMIEYCFVTLVVWAASILADDPIEVQVVQDSIEEPFGCPMRPPSPKPMKVRFQSLSTSSGLVFHRKTVAEDLLECFEADGFEELSATDISDCAEATEAAGLQMYRWENGNCTGYARGFPRDTFCKTNEDVVLYSVDAELSVPESYTLTLDRKVNSILAEWPKCHPDYPSNAAYFNITWNGTTIQLDGTTYEYSFDHFDICTDNLTEDLLEVTLEAFDETDTPVIAADTKNVTEIPVPEYFILTLHRSVSSIWAEWSKCHPDYPSKEPYFTITWNGTTIQLNSTTFEYRLQHADLCTNFLTKVDPGLLEVTLEAFDDNDNPVMAADTEVVTDFKVFGERFLLNSGNCLYYEDDTRVSRPTRDMVEEFCRVTLYGTMFIEYTDGNFATYKEDLIELESSGSVDDIEYHYVGLYKRGDQWIWQSGLLQEEDDPSVWSFGEPQNNRYCVQVKPNDKRLGDIRCDNGRSTYACHEIL